MAFGNIIQPVPVTTQDEMIVGQTQCVPHCVTIHYLVKPSFCAENNAQAKVSAALAQSEPNHL